MKTPKIYFLLVIVGLLQATCTQQRSATSGWSDARSGSSFETERFSDDKVVEKSVGNFAATKKMVYTAFVTLTVKRPDSAIVSLERLAAVYEGYVSESSSNRVVMRVKSDQTKAVIAALAPIGKIEHQDVTGSDVSERYYDERLRLENAEKARARYLELLAKAENVEAALKVEKELERLNQDIESAKGRLQRLENSIAFSTITVYVKEKKKPGIIGYVFVGMYYGLKWLFVRN